MAEEGATPRNPVPTVDVIIEMRDPAEPGGEARIVLIKRKNEPQGWALPGGFVDYGEHLATAARREANEETELAVELTELFHCYSDPSRDARLHTVSAVFIATAQGTPVGADDALEAAWFALDALPAPIVFDHSHIIDDYKAYRERGVRPPPDR